MTLFKGEISPGEVSQITELKERTARTLLSSLLENGILGSESPKGAISLRFRTFFHHYKKIRKGLPTDRIPLTKRFCRQCLTNLLISQIKGTALLETGRGYPFQPKTF